MTDFGADVTHGVYTLELLDELMGLIKGMGIRRLYWLYYGEYDVSRGGNLFRSSKYASETLEKIGDPVRAAVPLAHKHGLEIYGVLWPHDLGVTGTFPEGSPEADVTSIRRIGGTVQMVDEFIEQNPHVRAHRRHYDAPPNLESLPIRKVRLLSRDDSPTRIRKEDLQIWTSPSNYRYERKNVEFTLKDAVEPAPRTVHDRDGELMSAKGAPVRTLTLDGLDLTDKYILITTDIKGRGGTFRNTAMGMVEAYGPGPEPLPITVATRRAAWQCPRDFHTYGLEFDHGIGIWQVVLDEDNAYTDIGAGTSWRMSACEGVVAFARGKNEHVPTDPCEVYPEVRELWSSWIDRMMDAGVDGMDMRFGSHGIATNEPYEYGFNEPVVEEYRRRYGADPSGDADDLERVARLRGEYLTGFIRETSSRVRAAGKKMQVHVLTGAYPLRPDPAAPQPLWMPGNLHYDWRTWLADRLVDGIILRGGGLDDPVEVEVLKLANEMDVPVYLNRYVYSAARMDEYVSELESIYRDNRFAGFNVYEIQGFVRPAPDGSRLIPIEDKIERIRAKASELGLV
jgi:hypothetical protein